MLLSTLLLLSVASISQSAVLRGFEGRIVNGVKVEPGEIPYQIALLAGRNVVCGGSVINEYYVVTAAHCTDKTRTYGIIAGNVDPDSFNPSEINPVDSIRRHEGYRPYNSYINDIALLKLRYPIKPSNLVGFVTLPEQDETVPLNSTAIVSGFGVTHPNRGRLSVLRKTTLYISDQEQCRSIYKKRNENIHDSHICAYNPDTRTDSCMGDSGGPVTVDGKLVGIVSWGVGCAEVGYPSVNTRVPSYIDWIKKNTV